MFRIPKGGNMKKVGLSAALLAGALLVLTSVTLAQGPKFASELAGKNEVPPVDTPATGRATFEVSKDGNSLMYTLSVTNITDVTMAHIHIGDPGTNGGHVAPLYPVGMAASSMGEKKDDMATKPDDMAAPKKMSGIIAKGTIRAKDLVGPLQGKTIADLVAQIQAGKAYVNVHTRTHGDGEIRGPIK